ncbi:uncharacterized protein LOC133146985 [Syngnathus typhle]|uniref:uncharacterized protein LOC133146985 n=1 Tax=Syngnathus typhle TaxID=161592 RepID=UPI002A6A56B5|nr:uncharacterized protein LOC133146985 [Syngnathus typhle]
MVDSGAAFTCVRPEDAIHLPMSGHFVRTIGFEGIKQLIPSTRPVKLCWKDRTINIPVLVSDRTPIALLGRDALCRLNCTIKCSPDGCVVEVPHETCHKVLMQSKLGESMPTVYWIGDISNDLLKPFRKWERFIYANTYGAKVPEYPYHCTLQYTKDSTQAQAEEWLQRQPHEVQLNGTCIVLGPQGVAMKMHNDGYLNKEFKVKDSVPHVTLMVSEDCVQQNVGEMMLEAETLKFVPLKENNALWVSDDRRFMKIMISAQGYGQPQTVQLSHESVLSVAADRLQEEMLQQVPEHVWSRHGTDIGLVKSAQPVRVDLRPGCKPPWKPQYPLKEEAVRGIETQIEGLLVANVLTITQTPLSNTPILPLKKPDNSHRLVHDLRAVNEVVVDRVADVPDPHTLLTQIPPDAECFTVVDLCGAFFSVPLSRESQGLFGFTFKGQFYQYQRLPMGYKHSPHVFNKVLRDDLEGLERQVQSTVLQYVDDIIVCASDVETCHKDSIKLLQILAEKGHKVSQKKLQYCQLQVDYLGQKISRGLRRISDGHLEAIRTAPKPRTVRQMLTFLGIAGYSASWVEEYAKLVGPLRAMIKDTGNNELHAVLDWTQDGHIAFETIKARLQEAPALALPDYSKNFVLFTSASAGGRFACAVLCQPTGTGSGPQPVAYYSTSYSEVEMGLPPCYRMMVGVYLMYDKASSVTMGYPVTILTHHSLRTLLNHGKYTLTESRLRDYYRLLEQEDVTLARCTTVNPADFLPTSEDGEPHDCVHEAERFSRLRSDLQAIPLGEADLELWTDGSCYRVGEALCAGYAVIQAHGAEFVTIKAEVIPQPASAQLAELVGLTEACLLAEGKRVTVYTDSAYAHSVCHLFGAVWRNRGFKKTDGSPIQHQAQILKLLDAMMRPSEIAIAKCAAHKSDASRVTQGNRLADEAARAITKGDRTDKTLLVTHEVDLEDKVTLRDVTLMQEAVSPIDKHLWVSRGACRGPDGVWRNHEGLVVAPPDLLGLLIQEAHGLAHVSRGEVKRKITAEYGFWAPYLLEQIDHVIGKCVICLKNNVRRGVATPTGYIPTPNGPMRELVVDFVDMIQSVEGKRYMLVVVDRFSRWPEACPTKRKDAQSVAKFLCREVICRWGLPDRISSDNGKEFVDKTVKLILQKLGIKQRLGAVYHPQSQGICEKMNGVLKTRISKICQHTGLNWIAALPLALMVCRSSALRDLHLTPHELVTGRRMPSPCLRTSGKGPSLSILENEMKAYVKHLTTVHRNISTYVVDRQKQEEVQERLEANAKDTVQPGDKVYVKVFRRKWFNERRQGPFEVVRCTGTAVQVKGSPTWYHLTHCVKVPEDKEPRGASRCCDHPERPPERESPEDRHREVERHDQDVDAVGPAAPVPGGVRVNATNAREGRQFDCIDLGDAPNAAGSDAPQCGTTKSRAAGRGPLGGQGRTAERNDRRPVRRRVRPRRYVEQC